MLGLLDPPARQAAMVSLSCYGVKFCGCPAWNHDSKSLMPCSEDYLESVQANMTFHQSFRFIVLFPFNDDDRCQGTHTVGTLAICGLVGDTLP